jgi:hypothetical protein
MSPTPFPPPCWTTPVVPSVPGNRKSPVFTAVRPSGGPRERNLPQRVATRAAFLLDRLQASIVKPHANWIHVLFSKPRANANR